jgi:hypothetical protein
VARFSSVEGTRVLTVDVVNLASNRARVARITPTSLASVRRARYARLIASLCGITSSTYARSGSSARASTAASSRYWIDAGSVMPGRTSSTRRCSGVYRAT